MKWKENKDIANTLGKKRLLYQEGTQILGSTEEQGSRSKPRRSHLPHPTPSLWFSGIWTGQVFLISHPSPSYTIFLEASLGPRVLPWAVFHLWSPEGKALWATVTRLHGAPLQSGFSRPHKRNCFRAELHACQVKMRQHHSVSEPSWSAFMWCWPKTRSVQIDDSLDSCCFSPSRARLFATRGTIAHQAPLSMGFSRQDYWNRLPFPLPEDLPNPAIELSSPSSSAL